MTVHAITTENAHSQDPTVRQQNEAQGLMIAAQAHKNASQWCSERPMTDPPNMDLVFAMIVSFELILLSVEQSLKLLLLLRFGIKAQYTHDLIKPYNCIVAQDKRGKEVVGDIVRRMNALVQADDNIEEFSEKELAQCLQDHHAVYTNLRYFDLAALPELKDRHGPMSPRDRQIMRYFAQSLIAVNLDNMSRCKIA